ncbi:MAG TPA: hypothetical protein VFC19_45995, partial [Candidatus Limnocylindrales bacterium]|nr:hypothetical protein [Candidatus Limnocylindrales bacterium]
MALRRFIGTAYLMTASAVSTIVTFGLAGWLPATRAGAAPQPDCPMLPRVSMCAADLPAYPPQPGNRPTALTVREVLDAESKRVNPPPGGPARSGQPSRRTPIRPSAATSL